MSEGIKNGTGLSVSQIRDLFYPIGIKVISRVSPASLIGGTWEMLEDGRTIVAASDPGVVKPKYQVGAVGGEAEVTLEEEHIAPHWHPIAKATPIGSSGIEFKENSAHADTLATNGRYWWSYTGRNFIGPVENYTSYRASPHDNMPPYISEYIWTRIA